MIRSNKSFLRPLYSLLFLIIVCSSPLSASKQQDYLPDGYRTLLRERIVTGQETRVLHIGDSHLSGGFMTTPIERAIRELNSRSLVERIGVPGATFASILKSKKMDLIKTFAPDVIIVSLGTNDSYTYRFLPGVMRTNIEQFMSFVSRELKTEPLIIFTTPPLSYIKKRVRSGSYRTKSGKRRPRYKTTYSFNTSTLNASDVILSFARDRGYATYDLTRSMQTKPTAEASASHYLSQGWLHTDRVHYTRVGYARLGDYVARWLIDLLSMPEVDHQTSQSLTDSITHH